MNDDMFKNSDNYAVRTYTRQSKMERIFGRLETNVSNVTWDFRLTRQDGQLVCSIQETYGVRLRREDLKIDNTEWEQKRTEEEIINLYLSVVRSTVSSFANLEAPCELPAHCKTESNPNSFARWGWSQMAYYGRPVRKLQGMTPLRPCKIPAHYPLQKLSTSEEWT
jgi:hypothetical protein